MNVTYQGIYNQIKLAVEDANELFNSPIFYELIEKHPGFSCSEKKPIEIADLIRNSTLKIQVKLYKPRWKWSKVLGYFVKSHPNTIFLNIRKIYRETNSITNTIIHECIHALDYNENSNIIEFGHNCGYFDNTAPYEIGNIAESIVNGSDFEQTGMLDVLDTVIEDRIF
jgi:hypothetical protein|tara:strand:- start:652 stop:1158 length:507 start_codon:yes stop_codon:yes gene_type:complete